MNPSIGRIVHYMNHDGMTHPAIITEVIHSDKGTQPRLTLTVFKPAITMPSIISIAMAAGPRDAEPGQWWWPERI